MCNEIGELFPSPFVHIVREETIKNRRAAFSDCQALMIPNGLTGPDDRFAKLLIWIWLNFATFIP